jgi:hypothetical protein
VTGAQCPVIGAINQLGMSFPAHELDPRSHRLKAQESRRHGADLPCNGSPVRRRLRRRQRRQGPPIRRPGTGSSGHHLPAAWSTTTS